ncbi:aspartate--tRNA(Asn) ligase [Candidatus Saccharibacteria bacterium]|nr:aspartate--tRNA(Asn) ligase [Candidatus Saccharibacteria bacterium]
MIERTPIKNLPEHAERGSDVTVGGFVEGLRDQRRIQFLIIGDETGSVQAVNFHGDDDPSRQALTEKISNLTTGSVVEVSGQAVQNERIKLGGLEVRVEDLVLHSLAQPGLPIRNDTNLDTRLDWRYLDLRERKKAHIFDIQTTLEHSAREWWGINGYKEIHSPKLLAQPSEGGSEEFAIPYFGMDAYLAQSPQFYKQMAMAAGFNRVFEIGPVFRANPSFTARHDTEFTSVDAEISWVDSHHDVMDAEESLLRHTLQKVQDKHGLDIIANFGEELNEQGGIFEIPNNPFPRITLDEARRMIEETGYEIPEGAKDLDPESERILCKLIREKYGSDFVFVTDYPVSVRPFYHMRHEDNPNLTKSYDLLWRGVEITTGAQREHRHDQLIAQIKEKGLNEEDLKFYTDFFKYGCPPHGGFGLGLTRMLTKITGLNNVREVTFLYRGPKRLTP